LNDENFDNAARSLILLLILRCTDDKRLAIDTVLHVWYSVLLNSSQLELLMNRVLPELKHMSEAVENQSDGALCQRNWALEAGVTISATFLKEQWMTLPSLFDNIKGTVDEGFYVALCRMGESSKPTRVDYRDLRAICMTEGYRAAYLWYQVHGVIPSTSSKFSRYLNP